MRRLITAAAVLMAGAVLVAAALAATATLFGGATTNDGILTLVSNTGDSDTANDSSGASFSDAGVTTFASIATLAAEFNVTDDDCSGGSPRFQVQVQTASGPKNVFVYLGSPPSFTGCSQNVWIASGNLVGSTDGRFDTSQVQTGTQVSTYAQALALVGSLPVTGISIVVDSGWAFADKEQTVMVRNVKINDSTFFTGKVEPKPDDSNGKSPGQACRALRAEMGVDAFRAAFGANKNKRNAFGKCVSKMARMKNDEARAAAVVRIDAAAESCLERTMTGRGHGKGKGHGKAQAHSKVKIKGKGHGKGFEKLLDKCLRHVV
jgi:hypothetical protein